MKTPNRKTSPASAVQIVALAMVLAATGCSRVATQNASEPEIKSPARVDPLAIVLSPQPGEGRTDQEIRQRQEQIRAGRQTDLALEQLGWLFVAKARETFDPGCYKLAEQCAVALDARQPHCAEALLLRGHVLQNLHRFAESETVARELVAARGRAFDFGVLGDALMELGRIQEAVAAYQSMVDQRPDLQSYSRIAHVRWLTGDLEGAIEMMRAAASAGSPADADSSAWVNTRLAGLEWQAGDPEAARRRCDTALALRPDYPPALLLRGKIQLSRNQSDPAIADLERAVQQNPLPEYQWTLAEALRTAGRNPEAEQVETQMRRHGAKSDPRTYSLYLATRGAETALALRLAEKELLQRQDVFTQDALAWALAAAGRMEAARAHMELALAQHTQDARLWLHAAVIALRSGRSEEAQGNFARATRLSDLLLPSERTELMQLAQALASNGQKPETISPPTAATKISASATTAEGN
jgi:tetratricopeptide (TPR) repeat protein